MGMSMTPQHGGGLGAICFPPKSRNGHGKCQPVGGPAKALVVAFLHGDATHQTDRIKHCACINTDTFGETKNVPRAFCP